MNSLNNLKNLPQNIFVEQGTSSSQKKNQNYSQAVLTAELLKRNLRLNNEI